MLIVGRVIGVHGVRGWVKVFSETDPRKNILTYSPWYLGTSRQAQEPAEGRCQGKRVIARLVDVEDRDQAAALVGQDIAVRREQLPPPSPDELYWADLEGLAVETADGRLLGRVSHLLATAANDVLVVKGERERLIPFLWEDVIKDVDFDRGLILVHWDPDF
jgi:16S rRNA processing protein RimM